MVKRSILWQTIILSIIFTLLAVWPALAAETIIVRGNRIKYSVKDELLVVEGSAELVATDVTIRSDTMRATYRDGEVIELKAAGNVEIEKEGDSFFAKEFTYHVKKKTGIILEISGSSEIEDSQEHAYFAGKSAVYHEDYIEINDGHLTTCDLEHPHYLFRAKRVELYPDDKIKAWHMSFWEFNGKIPLLYFPYYVISLKEEDDAFSPQVGYSAATGFFVKAVYRFYSDGEQHGEIYGDWFQKQGPAGGAKYWYMDSKNHEGSLYFYLQKQDEFKSRPYLTAKHSQRDLWGGLSFNSNTTLNRYGIRDTLTNVTSVGYRQKTNSITWDENYSGIFIPGRLDNKLKNTLRLNWTAAKVRFDGEFYDDRDFTNPNRNYWRGHLRASQSTPVYDWTAYVNKRGNSNPLYEFYNLPELTLKVKGSGLEQKDPLRPYLAPFTVTTIAGHYIENERQLDAYRWYNRLDFSKEIPLFGPLVTTASGYGVFKAYSTGDAAYEYRPSIELRSKPLKGFSSSVKYYYQKGAGTSPFKFDRAFSEVAPKVEGSATYSNNGLQVTTGTGYNLKSETFDLWNNSLNYRWGTFEDSGNIQITVPYNIEGRKFNDISASMSVRNEDLELKLGTKIKSDPWKVSNIEADVDWQINEDWHIDLQTAFDPSQNIFTQKQATTKAAIEVVRNLHCREMSLSVDVMQKEVWLTYRITAFPRNKVRVGANENDYFLFDADLGGITNGQ